MRSKKITRTRSVVILTGILFLSLGFCAREKESPAPEYSQKNLAPRTAFSGRIVFQSNLDGDNEIYLLTEEGLTPLTDNSWDDRFPVWSPDGEHIAFTANPKGNYDIFLMKADGSNIREITSSPKDEVEPAWFPDGEHLAFTREGRALLRSTATVFRVDLRTLRARKLVPNYSKTHGISHISPDADRVTFTAKRLMGWDVALFDVASDRVVFLDEGGKSCRGRFSPDGERLAYVSSKADGKGDVWMMDADGGGKVRLTARDDTHDYFPAWSPDGRFVVFNSSRQHDHDGDWQLMLVEIETRRITLLFDSPGSDVFPDWH